MEFNAAAYGPDVARILTCGVPSLRGLVAGASAPEELKKAISADLFAASAHPKGALAGLWLYFDCFDESHRISQADDSQEGSYWHGIAHRREPDFGNAAYWFRRVGRHAVFPEISKRMGGCGALYDPLRFVEECERGGREDWALEVQRAEWEVLFDYCARKRVD